MRGALSVILALLTLLASLASIPKLSQPDNVANISEGINQNITNPGMVFGSPTAAGGGFQIAPSGLIMSYITGGTDNVRRSIWPLALVPPFQVMFRGPTIINRLYGLAL